MITGGGVLVGALILVVGLIIGGIVGRITRPGWKYREPKPFCGCKHHYSMHDKDGRCREQIERWSERQDFHWVQCPCQHYTGPEPLPEVFA
jgi:hypothetical protein